MTRDLAQHIVSHRQVWKTGTRKTWTVHVFHLKNRMLFRSARTSPSSSSPNHSFNFGCKSRTTKYIVAIGGSPNLLNQPCLQLASKKLAIDFSSRYICVPKR